MALTVRWLFSILAPMINMLLRMARAVFLA
jgi:hypothetical protein